MRSHVFWYMIHIAEVSMGINNEVAHLALMSAFHEALEMVYDEGYEDAMAKVDSMFEKNKVSLDLRAVWNLVEGEQECTPQLS